MSIFQFGIAGPGAIAHQFAGGLSVLPDATLGAVASNSMGRAETFISEHAALFPQARAYGSYAEMAKDPSIDAVYVSNLNTQHAETAELFLSAGKPVICEKPFALNVGQTDRMIQCARMNNVFLMEAMWTRFLPVTRKAMEWIKADRIGMPVRAYSDFGMELMTEESRRTVALEKGGGALLDLGVYPISFFGMLFGSEPREITTTVTKAVTGVDSSFEAVFRFDEQERPFGVDYPTAVISVSIDRLMSNTMKIVGTQGYIEIKDFWMGRSAALYEKDANGFFRNHPAEEYAPQYRSTGYQYEAKEVVDRVREGKKESAIMSLSETRAIISLMDRLRSSWGIEFPQESPSNESS
ncbi:MAG: Gfo/Idh/MocA family oxidoreductase [Clostridiales bacterium]|nr:Gfo/Idh/MocA family oxidoreductase [Clostridiales bacterium]